MDEQHRLSGLQLAKGFKDDLLPLFLRIFRGVDGGGVLGQADHPPRHDIDK